MPSVTAVSQDKPIKWGPKLWGFTTAKTGFFINFDLYTGKSSAPAEEGSVGLATDVVLKLVREYAAVQRVNGIHLYMDNYYCSVRLFYELALINVLACGTVRTNRKGWPKQVAVSVVERSRYVLEMFSNCPRGRRSSLVGRRDQEMTENGGKSPRATRSARVLPSYICLRSRSTRSATTRATSSG